jgi:aryl-alcohol dehydrogenase-like predicted oxidoreductase
VAALQTEYSLMNRDPERNGLLETCQELGIGFVPWGPMGMGYLTQTLHADTKLDSKSDLRAGFDRFQPEAIKANQPFVDRITRLARSKNATTAQLSLAWLLAQKPFIVPIPGTGKVKHLHENIEAANLVLTADDLKEIDGALSEVTVHGGRMNESQMQVVEQ